MSVLEDAEEGAEGDPVEIAGIKNPVTLLANFSPLIWAVAALLALVILSLLFWWLQRRYGEKWRRAPVEVSIFDRISPHEWVYAELQGLLERRLPESGELIAFYSELSRILKQYLGARFRVDLMERTTSEVASRLMQGGASSETQTQTDGVLQQCDAVKFAGARPDASSWKAVVEEIYRIVDSTRPAEASSVSEREEVAS